MILDRAVAFLGPSLPAERARAILDVEVRPPAACGDVYRAAIEEPRAILLIDGAFETVRSVFHKEILWALARGVHVFGASSLGALRAAELDAFGMVGVGEIYASYRDGRRERDDAVAVLHGPAELGWPLLTRALVDIEATLDAAQKQGVLGPADRAALQRAAEACFWRERTYPRIVEDARNAGWSDAGAEAFLAWLPGNEVRQKERDAAALFQHVAEAWDALEEPFRAGFRFEETAAWRRLRLECDWSLQGVTPAEFDQLAAGLGGDPAFRALELEALAGVLAEEAARERDAPADAAAHEAAVRRFRRESGLERAEDVAEWMRRCGLAHADYLALVDRFRDIERAKATRSGPVKLALLRLLRSRGFFTARPG